MDSDVSKWAILIGIDFYPGGDNLDGCVNDVNAIGELCRNLGFQPDRITSLLSPRPEHPAARTPAGNDPDAWPSYENIVGSIRSMLEQSRPSDVVYIHFSGRISQVPTILLQIRKSFPL